MSRSNSSITASKSHARISSRPPTTSMSASSSGCPRPWDRRCRCTPNSTGAWPDNHSSVKLPRTEEGGFELNASADFLRLRDIAPWLGLVSGVPPELAALRDGGGDVEHLVLRLQRAAGVYRYTASGEVKDL